MLPEQWVVLLSQSFAQFPQVSLPSKGLRWNALAVPNHSFLLFSLSIVTQFYRNWLFRAKVVLSMALPNL
jgi:hypothetical protein